MVASRTFPVVPTSNRSLLPGDFWALPLRRGGWFACARIIAIGWRGAAAPRVSIVVGLHDWCQPLLPDAENIAGARLLDAGQCHVKTVGETGGAILGNRPLEFDGGLEQLLGGRTTEELDGWGYLGVADKAHAHFGRHFPVDPVVAVERPPGLGEGTITR